MKRFKPYLNFVLFICAVLGLTKYCTRDPDLDLTDDPAHKVRSHMGIFTDYETGCEYLGRFFGGLTPRLDASGKQICGRRR